MRSALGPNVGKAAIYPRWASKAAVVAAAIGWWRAQLATSEVPDTGTLRGDIEALIVMVPDFGDAERQTISVILGAATAASRDPALAAALDEHVQIGRAHV